LTFILLSTGQFCALINNVSALPAAARRGIASQPLILIIIFIVKYYWLLLFYPKERDKEAKPLEAEIILI
jgi:hypothetical protein